MTLESSKSGKGGGGGFQLRDEILSWLHRFVASMPLDSLHLVVGMGLLEVILGHLDTEAVWTTPDA